MSSPAVDRPLAGTEVWWRLRVLGPLELCSGDDRPVPLGGPQRRLVLALLSVSAPHPRTTDQLVDDVWHDDGPERARKTIQVHVATLRRHLGGSDGPLQPAPGGYRFEMAHVSIDANEFERIASKSPEGDDPYRAVSRYRDALDMWAGEAYADVAEAELIDVERVRLHELRLAALERRIDMELAVGRHRELIGELEALTVEHPFREHFVAQLSLAQYRAGRQADALQTMRRVRRTLNDELGLDPGPQLRELERRILTQDATLACPAVEQASGGPPAVGCVSAEDAVVSPAVRGYELRRRLAGSDVVATYLAYQASLAREVMVSVIAAGVANGPAFVRRFEADAQRVAELEHPHVVPLLDYWRDPGGAYLVTRWLRGGRLKDALAKETMTLATSLRIAAQVGGALAHAHRVGVVHGSVTSSAVLLDDDENAYLVGFRVADARVLELDESPGTVDAAPDGDSRTQGGPSRSRAGDVRGLAGLVHEMLIGRRPDGGETDVGDGLAPGVSGVLDAALDVTADSVPDDAEEFVRALTRAAGNMVDARGALTDVRNPYKGLRAFGRADAADFYGRDELVGQLLDKTLTHRLVAVVGPSGSGKSSMVRAGLLPRLTDRHVLVTEMTPGAYPFDELETALLRVAVDRPSGMLDELRSDDRGLLRLLERILPDVQHELLLVVDQFEELFTLVREPGARESFLQSLAAAVSEPESRLRVVLTLRADFFDRPLEDPAFGALVKQGVAPVITPAREELVRIVEGPAAAVGLELDAGLTSEIVADVAGQPGGLPLLQYALTELVRTRNSDVLTKADYQRIGGVTGALGTRAEELYAELDDDVKEAARQVLLRLVTTEDGTDDVRRRVRRSELLALRLNRRAVDTVLDHFGQHRLLSFDRDPVSRGPTVEVAHEALLREWERLRDWIETRRADLVLHRRFATAVDEWEHAGRDGSFLARGGRLEQFEDGLGDTDLTLTTPEQDYLDESRALRAADRTAARERADRQARANTRLRRLLAIVAVLAVAAGVAGLVAFAQGRRADAAAVTAEARRVGAQALAATDVDHALLLAVAGVQLEDSPDTRANLLTTLGRSPELAGVLRGDPGYVFGTVSVSTDGRTGAVHDDANQIRFFDTSTREVEAVYEAEDSKGTAALNTGRATFHPHDGPIAVGLSTLGWQPVRLLDPVTYEELPDSLQGFPTPNLLPWGMTYSPDGTRLAVAFDRYPDRRWPMADGSVIAVWEIATPQEPIAVLDVPPYTHEVAFAPDGRHLFSTTHTAPPLFDTQPGVTVHDLETPTALRTLDVPSHPFALSPDGTRLAAASTPSEGADATTGTDVLIMDAMTGTPLHRLSGHTGPVTDVAFSRDGALLASAAADRTVAVWDVATGDRINLLAGHAGDVTSVAFGPDGTTVLSAGLDGAVLVWDRQGNRRFVSATTATGDFLESDGVGRTGDTSRVAPAGDAVLSIATLPDGDETGRTHMQVIDAGTGRAGPIVDTGHGFETTGVWHPDGQRFATAGFDGVVKVWDASTMTVEAERQVSGSWVTGLAYVDDGRQLLFADLAGATVQRLDANTLEPRSTPAHFNLGWISLLYAHPQGDTVAMITSDAGVDVSGNEDQPDDRLLLLDRTSLDVLHDLDLGFDGEHAAVSPDGAHVAVVGAGGEFTLIDIASGMARPPSDAHDGVVASVAYAPNGDLIASGGTDGRVVLWDGQTGARLGAVRVTGAGTATFVGFAPDGHSIKAATRHGRMHTIDVRAERWIDHACAVAGRDLTQDEWRQTFGDRPYRATC